MICRPSRSMMVECPSLESRRILWPFRYSVVTLGSRACLLNAPATFIMPAIAPPVTLDDCVYLKSARLLPAPTRRARIHPQHAALFLLTLVTSQAGEFRPLIVCLC